MSLCGAITQDMTATALSAAIPIRSSPGRTENGWRRDSKKGAGGDTLADLPIFNL